VNGRDLRNLREYATYVGEVLGVAATLTVTERAIHGGTVELTVRIGEGEQHARTCALRGNPSLQDLRERVAKEIALISARRRDRGARELWTAEETRLGSVRSRSCSWHLASPHLLS
jgi:hypothetical protein